MKFEAMHARWKSFCAGLGARADVVKELFDEVEGMYARPARAYHNLGHVAACLRAAEELVAGGLHWRVELAIWLHDCIYEPLAPDNEQRSAEVGAEFARRLGGAEGDAAVVHRLILATRHVAPPADGDEAVVVDADLSILAAPAPEYAAYTAAIRQEYHAIAEDQYRAGRMQFVEQMLARPAIFATSRGQARWEQAARVNLSAEAARLAW